MCSRIKLGRTIDEIIEIYGVKENKVNFVSDKVIEPPEQYPVIIISGENRVMEQGRWGLIPEWVVNPQGFSTLFNARVETLNEKPSFKDAIPCIVPVSGFRVGDTWVEPEDGEVLPLAGLYTTYHNDLTFTIVTMDSTDGIEGAFRRMPVVCNPDKWLNGRTIEQTHKEYRMEDIPIH